MRLEAGDVVVFPHGDAHVLASGEGMRGPHDLELHAQARRGRLPLALDLGGSGRDPVHVLCGFLACDARPFNPLLDALPRVLHAKRRDGASGMLLDQLVSLAVEESTSPRPGGAALLARLSELMFLDVVREHLAHGVAAEQGWLAGLRDETVGRALALVHARPAHPWTIEELACESGTSRSMLAERFTALVGIPPMHYVARWRMQLAASLLETPANLARIAEEVGYSSEAAFSRAFKKVVGVSPATWRARRAS